MGLKPKVYRESDLQKGPSGRMQFPAMSQGDKLELSGYFYGMAIQPEAGGSVTTALFTPPRKHAVVGGNIPIEYTDVPPVPVSLEIPYEGLIDELSGFLASAGAAALEGRPALQKLSIRKGYDSHWIIDPRREP